ncbi:hypothetical protein CRG98_025716 [Punica granatum]|uniref:Secreted protein n=1 Tax=Punica granatum TaxID=22663 RepID=A0A2I0JCF5_PUNGR|nr:hypothetical protein CRG98_025716 [Punica granatum]
MASFFISFSFFPLLWGVCGIGAGRPICLPLLLLEERKMRKRQIGASPTSDLPPMRWFANREGPDTPQGEGRRERERGSGRSPVEGLRPASPPLALFI